MCNEFDDMDVELTLEEELEMYKEDELRNEERSELEFKYRD